MIETPFVQTIVDIALVVVVLLLIPCTWRAVVGPSPADRLQAIDTINNLLIGIIVLLALVQDSGFFVDLGIALGALGFVATLAISRYLCEGRVF
ncbi:MAG: hypothetical protein OHK0046_21470 [Anaerolineae bacterium]